MDNERGGSATDRWVAEVSGRVAEAGGALSQPDRKRYKLPLLLSCARRVAAFCPECGECQALQGRITDLAGDLDSSNVVSRRSFKSHAATIKTITRHLRRGHRLVEQRHYVKYLVIMGAAFGISTVIFGLVLLNFGVTLLLLNVTLPALVIRVAFSYTLGRLMDRRASKRGRVL